MAFYDTYGDSQRRRLDQQAQNNQALQAFADFMQKQQQVRPDNAYKQALARQANATADFNGALNGMIQNQLNPNGQLVGQSGALPPNAGINQPGSLAGIPQNAQYNPYTGQPMQQQSMVGQAMSGQPQTPFQLTGLNARGMQFQNPNYKSASEKRRTEKQDFTVSTTLREKFESLPEVKDYNVITPNIKSMEKILDVVKEGKLKNYTGSDQALVTMFNKLTDPQSVVRESEFARTPQNVPMVNRIMGALAQVPNGGIGWTNEDREALVIAAEIIYNERGDMYSQRLREYNELADAYGIDPKKVTKNLKPHNRGQFSRIDNQVSGSGYDADSILGGL